MRTPFHHRPILLAFALSAAWGCSFDLDAYRERARSRDSGSDGAAELAPDGGDSGEAAEQPDASSETDARADAGDSGPAIVRPPAATVVMPTSGGGTAASAVFRLTLSFGAPQPGGRASSGGFVMTLGAPPE